MTNTNYTPPAIWPESIITETDTYKYSHHLQYPKGLTNMFSYVESRGGMYPEVMFYGLQATIKQFLLTPFTQEDIDFAEWFVTNHVPGLTFNRDGWEYILQKYNGFLPVRIKAVKEGRIIPVKNVVVTVESTDPKCAWLPSYIETLLLRGVWPASTVATRSRRIRDIIQKKLELTSDLTNPIDKLSWSLHDFGMRGAKGKEAAGFTGSAHLINFLGTDNTNAIFFLNKYYNVSKMPAFSIAASEHSVATIYGKDNELEYFKMMFENFASKCKIYANVGDSYDVYNAAENIIPELKEALEKSGATMVFRPDSGNPTEVVMNVFEILFRKFDHIVNSKGYKVLQNVRIIQGDGVNEQTIISILDAMQAANISAENIAFGCGGYLLDTYTRDTQKWAMKTSAATVDGKFYNIMKDPITDPGKKSKAGKLELVSLDGTFKTIRDVELPGHVSDGWKSELETVYENGVLVRDMTFDEIRAVADSQ